MEPGTSESAWIHCCASPTLTSRSSSPPTPPRTTRRPSSVLRRPVRYRHFHGNTSQRYRYLRTTTENHFMIMDLYLAESSRSRATEAELDGYEDHRAEDQLRIGSCAWPTERSAGENVGGRRLEGGRCPHRDAPVRRTTRPRVEPPGHPVR